MKYSESPLASGIRSVLLLLALLPGAIMSQDFIYVTNNGTITITGYTGSGGQVLIPDTISGMPVTCIGSNAFARAYTMRSVEIPETVTSIGFGGFYDCLGLTNLTIPNSITNIDAFAFANCENMVRVAFGTNLSTIGSRAFYNCSAIPEITVPASVTVIEGSAFDLCMSMTNIAVDPRNATYSGVDGVLFSKDGATLLKCPSGRSGTYTVTTGVSVIGDYAFSAVGLLEVVAGNSVTNVGIRAFGGCLNLAKVTLGRAITSVGYDAFGVCPSLTNISVDPLNEVYSSMDGVLFDKARTTLTACPGGKAGVYEVPGTVTSIGAYAFDFCTNLTSVVVPDSVQDIGQSTFANCFGLTNAVIGKGVTRLPSFAFSYCKSLATVYFWGNAPSLGSYVFQQDTTMVCYLPGTIGWGSTFGGRPTAPWLLPFPVILSTAPNFGVQTNRFGFCVSWATNASVVVEAATDLFISAWLPVGTNTLVDGWSYLSDPDWTNYPARFYRVRWP